MKNIPKVLALVLALAMMVSVVAFAEADDIMTPYGKYPETVLMTTVKSNDPNAKWPEGDNLDNNVMTRYIKDVLNVEVKTLWDVDGTEYINKLSLDIVADSLPDMFTLNNDNYLVYRSLLDNDMLADLTEAYEKTAGWYMLDTAESFERRHFAPYTEDGKLMGIPTGRYGYEHEILWLRTDILEAIGMKAEEISTIADIETYLTKAKEAFPDTFGLALNATDPLNFYSSFSADPLAQAFGAQPRQWVTGEDGKVVWGSTMPGMKDALTVLADWYQKGLIDKEFATRVGGGLTQAVTTGGQATAWFAPWWYGWSIVDLPKNVEGADVITINAPVDAEGKFNVAWPSPAGDVLLINKKCATPEAAIKMMNVEYDMWRGFDAEAKLALEESQNKNNPTYLDASWTYLFPTGGVNMEYSGVVPTFGHALRNFIDNGDAEGLATPAEVTESINVGRFVKGEPDAEQYRGSYYSRYMASTIVDAENVVIHYPSYSQMTSSMADIMPSLLTLEQTAILQIIIGEKPVDEFDNFVAQWYAEGGQTVTDEVNAMVAAQ